MKITNSMKYAGCLLSKPAIHPAKVGKMVRSAIRKRRGAIENL